MRGLSIILFIFSVCALVKIIDLKQDNAILRDNTQNELKAIKSDNTYLSERLTIYYLITIEQNEGLNKFNSCREWKANNKKLTNLMQKL
jgi:hypothetical protein